MLTETGKTDGDAGRNGPLLLEDLDGRLTAQYQTSWLSHLKDAFVFFTDGLFVQLWMEEQVYGVRAHGKVGSMNNETSLCVTSFLRVIVGKNISTSSDREFSNRDHFLSISGSPESLIGIFLQDNRNECRFLSFFLWCHLKNTFERYA